MSKTIALFIALVALTAAKMTRDGPKGTKAGTKLFKQGQYDYCDNHWACDEDHYCDEFYQCWPLEECYDYMDAIDDYCPITWELECKAARPDDMPAPAFLQ